MPSNTGLNELIIALQDAAAAITNNPTLDPLSPEGQKLQKTARDITDCAVTIGGFALDALQPELRTAIENLKNNIDAASDTLAEIDNVHKALSIAAAILAVAASVASKDPVGSVQALESLVASLQNITDANA